jgi:hypothetical protein
MAGLLRRFLDLDDDLRGVVESLPFQLEVTDARMRSVYGERWWDDVFEALRRSDGGDDDGRA